MCVDVRACDLGPAIVLVSYRSGAVRVLTGDARKWWLQTARTGKTEEHVPLVDELITQGVVERETETARPWTLVTGIPWQPNWGTYELPMGFAPHPRASLRDHVVGAIGLTMTLTIAVMGPQRNRMSRMVRLVDRVSRCHG